MGDSLMFVQSEIDSCAALKTALILADHLPAERRRELVIGLQEVIPALAQSLEAQNLDPESDSTRGCSEYRALKAMLEGLTGLNCLMEPCCPRDQCLTRDCKGLGQ